MAKGMKAKIGSWAFIGGIIIALIVGLYQAWTIEQGENFLITTNGGYVAWLLAIIGVIVGILAIFGHGTITAKEVPAFLLAGIALVVMYGVFKEIAISPWLGSLFTGISMSLAIFVAPAIGILSILAIYAIGKD